MNKKEKEHKHRWNYDDLTGGDSKKTVKGTLIRRHCYLCNLTQRGYVLCWRKEKK